MRSVPLKLSSIISLLSVHFTCPLVAPPARILDSAASADAIQLGPDGRRNPEWSERPSIWSIQSVNSRMRASCAAPCRTAVVTSSTVDPSTALDRAPRSRVLPLCARNVHKHRRSATMRDRCGTICFLSQFNDGSESGRKSQTHCTMWKTVKQG